ncbi:MAG: Crp/Fnr family transcriptional regulator [Chroococcidiopsidaceae cyanobacterium CP_BM_ER_R8_30]|nr:Crp/Fnr family transcriptional regulator [Chroococcidiopsidaceae cyanobacterium CP_BM_ER_R8_30]
MSERSLTPAENRLLAALPSDEYQRLFPNLETVSLDLKQALYEPREPIQYVYFPKRGVVVSLLAIMANRTIAEVGIVGNEGFVGLPVFLGAETTPFRAIVQIPGNAMRMKVDVFKDSINSGSSLPDLLHHYTYMLISQISQSAACHSRRHSVAQRCCRWLLMNHDCVDSDQFPITQEFLSQMLSVRRASVTVVVGQLQKAGLLRHYRGQMTILDRQGLEAVACECYRLIKEEFDRF